MKVSDVVAIILAGVAIYGVYTAGKSFVKELDRVDANGLSLAGLASLGMAGGLLLWRLDVAGSRTQNLVRR